MDFKIYRYNETSGGFDEVYSYDNKDYNVLGLYPVTISRDLFPEKPADLLHDSLHSATDYKALSPADRVFGWVHQQGKGAWKGQLRIQQAVCEIGSQAIEHFGNEECSFHFYNWH